MDTAAGTFVPERSWIDRLGAAGLPVPRVIGCSDEAPAHLLLTWIDGEPLSSASPVAAQRDVGRLLRRVHALPGGPPYAGSSTVDAWIAGWLNYALAWWRDHAGAPQDAVDDAWSWFHRLQPLLATRGAETMLFDGRPEHFLVRGDDVVGMIDLHDLCAGDAAMDFAVLAVDDEPLLRAVIEGYRPSPDEQAAFAELIPFYRWLRRLAAAEWHSQHGDPQRVPGYLRQL